jgi:hypothetical protein
MIRAGSLILQEGRQWAVSALVDPPVTIPGGAMIHWHPSNDSEERGRNGDEWIRGGDPCDKRDQCGNADLHLVLQLTGY